MIDIVGVVLAVGCFYLIAALFYGALRLLSFLPGARPRVLCRICRRLYHEPGRSLQWHANSFGRSECPACQS